MYIHIYQVVFLSYTSLTTTSFNNILIKVFHSEAIFIFLNRFKYIKSHDSLIYDKLWTNRSRDETKKLNQSRIKDSI